ncbi:gamma-glutamylcyclotransferase [Rhodoplanes sp. TEM]|uniref:Gamma-glutamylcyclotransferase n=1 Tax=Rhodoplanes tepidamans TaxID=200616 RepID=A0ABT5JDS3_RHOTP|nr:MULTISPECIES: gamma-glutamylcyclotransferase family protein [Rhodoplanes]MDC7787813.1 gamma-glutamylcyclotransferase [Rhodoplanes tepidamans]MDC7987423.1 gamma-glutamylcyclotransferase [Rhodoplanes sp. TEM]MDQ0357729.1 cation transport regulator ChaC [Rhodoplanes tepidamans]
MTLYFAYGSNMSRALMRRRCPTAQEIGRAVLPGVRLLINDDGYATLVPAAGGRIEGVLWRLAPRDRAALNAYERTDVGLYRAVAMTVRAAGGRHCRALVYVARSRRAGRPRPGYMALVVGAAREVGLPEPYVAALARIAPTGFTGARPREIGEIA